MATRLKHRGVKRKRAANTKSLRREIERDSAEGKSRSLGDMSVDEFFERGLTSSSEEGSDSGLTASAMAQHTRKSQQKVKKSSSLEGPLVKETKNCLSQKLAKIDPDFYEYLQDNDSRLLDEMAAESDGSVLDDDQGEGLMQSDQSSSDDDMGTVEPRPLHITSRKEAASAAYGDGQGSSESEMEEEAEEGRRLGERLTKQTIQNWVQSASSKNPSLLSLRSLCTALHDAITSLLPETESTTPTYFLDDPSIFNSLVVSCMKTVPLSLSHLLPRPSSFSSLPKTTLPSTLKGWSRVKTMVKVYLCDLLLLLERLKESTMLCALLKHIQVMAEYCLCYPKLTKRLCKVLVKLWSEGESHVQVMAFMVLRRITLLQPHPSLHRLLKKLYLAFVSNCKFTSAKTLPQIQFMENCLVEFLSIDPATSYQHAFVYIRQLAVHLRTSLTSGKKQASQAVYNWQFIHCLDLWSHMLGHVTHESLRPLVYPLVQIMVGTVHVQPSARHYPIRLHIVRTLLTLSQATSTFVPVAPYLLEIFESHGAGVAGHVTTGKPPNMAILLHATKQQLQSSAFLSVLLNETYELLLQYFAAYSASIGFPELAYPSIVRLRKVCKSVSFSWLRLQLKQLIEKVETVSSEVTRQRAAVEFSPKDTEQVSVWERERREKGNALTVFLATWVRVHKQRDVQTEIEKTKHMPSSASAMTNDQPATASANQVEAASSCLSSEEHNDSEGESSADSANLDSANNEEDIVEDFRFSSDDSD